MLTEDMLRETYRIKRDEPFNKNIMVKTVSFDKIDVIEEYINNIVFNKHQPRFMRMNFPDGNIFAFGQSSFHYKKNKTGDDSLKNYDFVYNSNIKSFVIAETETTFVVNIKVGYRTFKFEIAISLIPYLILIWERTNFTNNNIVPTIIPNTN